MNILKSLVLACLAMAPVASCRLVPSSSSNGNLSNAAAVPVTESTAVATEPGSTTIALPERFTRSLDGTIGTLPVRVRISNDTGVLSGSYVYETDRAASHTAVNTLSLEGTIGTDGATSAVETVSDIEGNSSRTGELKGTLTNTTLGLRFVGTWTKPDKSGPLPVVLNELTSTPGGIRFVSTPMPSTSPKLASVVTVVYPKAEGGDTARAAAFNAAMEKLVREKVRTWCDEAVDGVSNDSAPRMLAYEVDYEIAAATDAVVSVVFYEFSNFGGAHPVSDVSARTFDFARGRFIGLKDAARDARAIPGRLAKLCTAALPTEDIFRPDLTPELATFDAWYVSRRGLTFVFPIAHVAGDTMQVFLPFSQVRDDLDPGGPLGGFVR